jgi:hypothetical protein
VTKALPIFADHQTAARLVLAFLTGIAIAASWGRISAADPDAAPLQQISTISDSSLAEASGLVKSRKHPGLFWTITDSGNQPILYAINIRGELLAAYRVNGAVNIDWEAIAIDDSGQLYLGDVGNSLPFVGLPRRWIYQVSEPNPLVAGPPKSSADAMPVVKIDKTHVFAFSGSPFDIEGMFWRHGEIYLTSKSVDGDSDLYRLPLEKQTKIHELLFVGKLPSSGMVTGAAVSADGRRLAICSYRHVTFYDFAKEGLPTVSKGGTSLVVRFPKTLIEGCCWDGNRLILISEDRILYQIDSRRNGEPSSNSSLYAP